MLTRICAPSFVQHQPAVNHFAGKEKELTKYQSIKKFSSDGKLYFIVKKDKKFGALSSSDKESVPVSHPVPATVKIQLIDRVRSKYQPEKTMSVK